ncbi:MAG: MinD/ParA family protein [Alphaproteobacteria bacterium]
MTDASATASMPPAADSAGRKLVAVASGKGGVGKTWFAITLAHALASMGQRILLFDGDLGLANVDIQLGLMPKRDLVSVFEGEITMKGALHRHEACGFDIVAGRSGSGTLAGLSTQRLADLESELVALAAGYDRVIVDLGAGIDRTIRRMAGHAGMVLVMTTDEPTALTDAYAFIKVLHGIRPDADIRAVVNLASSGASGERTYATLHNACRKFLKLSPPLAGIVRQDRLVRAAIRAQTPLLVRSPTTDAAADVEAIARRLAGVS